MTKAQRDIKRKLRVLNQLSIKARFSNDLAFFIKYLRAFHCRMVSQRSGLNLFLEGGS
jgi:hypothetical protein